jgi:hypothetical protein
MEKISEKSWSYVTLTPGPQFKDKFDRACVVHDYCYSSPWRGDPNGRFKCDLKFKELMDEICRGDLACLATSRCRF